MIKKKPAKPQKLRVLKPVDSRLPGPRPDEKAVVPWEVKGELFMSCNCTVFCPCVISMGKHSPTEGHCHAWMGVRIDTGHYGDEDLSGLNVGIFAEIPGKLGEGRWTVGLYVDERASHVAFDAICKIFGGKAGGNTGVLKYLVSNVLFAERQPVMIETDDRTRRISIGRKVQGEIEMVYQQDDAPVTIANAGYWIGPVIYVAKGIVSRLRDRGRVWDFAGRSAEIVPIDWSGPER